jgi:hypothetical protein
MLDEPQIDWVCTCSACPTQYEGTIDNIPFYFRYRWGGCRIEIGTGIDKYIWYEDIGDGLDGVMPHEDVMKYLSVAYREWSQVQT